MSHFEKVLLFLNVFLYGFLAIFSYAYVDLNLTISQNPVILSFVSLMQQLGYYHRPQATTVYAAFVCFAFGFFVYNLILAAKGKISFKYLKISLILNTLILIFAYPFLSSDLFNYLFDAKIIAHYRQSPYTHKPLDFPGDDWLRFMRWTHRYSPYGPLWLAASLVPTLFGFGKFILTLLAFKVFIASFHIINAILIYKTLMATKSKYILMGTTFYAANPLLLIEGVANAHNDVVLASFLLASIYLWICNKKLLSFFGIILGTTIKYISFLNLPWFLLFLFYKKSYSFIKLVSLNIITMAIFTYIFSSFRITVPFVSAGSTQIQFQPWYLFWTIPFVALIPKQSLIVMAIAISMGASLRYLPYLYSGEWSQSGTIEFMRNITLIVPLVAAVYLISVKTLRRLKSD